MSGPVDVADVALSEQDRAVAPTPVSVVIESRLAVVGSLRVRRALPTRGRRTVGAWCFADHFGPSQVDDQHRADIGPHPHIGLQTVTWLLEGELLHRDSLGSEQVVRPGQLNLMTAGSGVAHAEETIGGFRGPIHGVQLWVAQPSETRQFAPAFEHHPALPHVDFDRCDATVLVGELAGSTSAARRDTEHVGVDLALRAGATTVPLDPAFEYGLVVIDGAISFERQSVGPGRLLYLGAGRDELQLGAAGVTRALLLGGAPFGEQLLMWWNFVARTHGEVEAAYEDWAADSGRFGTVASPLSRIETGPPMWSRHG